eukprot:6420373-Prymnesium_polylepis.1
MSSAARARSRMAHWSAGASRAQRSKAVRCARSREGEGERAARRASGWQTSSTTCHNREGCARLGWQTSSTTCEGGHARREGGCLLYTSDAADDM